MTTHRLGAIALLAGLTAACGEGRAILNIDLLSFFPSAALDTAYVVPGGTSLTVAVNPVEVTTVELGGSVIDSAFVSVAADVQNTAGAGTVEFEVYIDTALVALFAPANLVAADTAVVSGPGTVPLAPPPFLVGDASVFASDRFWVGVRLVGSANAGPAMTGRVQVSALGVRIVVQDELTP
jgi:hypothetical protein